MQKRSLSWCVFSLMHAFLFYYQERQFKDFTNYILREEALYLNQAFDELNSSEDWSYTNYEMGTASWWEAGIRCNV